MARLPKPGVVLSQNPGVIVRFGQIQAKGVIDGEYLWVGGCVDVCGHVWVRVGSMWSGVMFGGE